MNTSVVETRQAESATGVAEDAWWTERSALLLDGVAARVAGSAADCAAGAAS
ncbi:hypothetical protein [Cellulomonas cellasea]|uniref:Uncharacterized protein n=1 Tax=Cellulomonas cellasea TaxID=43670 RepID=A0A4Y3KWN1_9CELL|nr:hypothetical protein [Cellulomonas cellasea]GEA88532.1 hypothetical protein CCE01nite_24810 [Cellulomonas cellasea]